MFIKFEGKDGATAMAEGKKYFVQHRTGKILLYVGDDADRWVLQDGSDHWHRAYVMNNEGQTIETIYGPKIDDSGDA